MTTDKELLEYAAKAAGLEGYEYTGADMCRTVLESWGDFERVDVWNPLTNDGDAFRLMVDLKMEVSLMGDAAWAMSIEDAAGDSGCSAYFNDDPRKAARQAIVRAAAELGKRMIEEEAIDSR
jgi:hypothetical protein